MSEQRDILADINQASIDVLQADNYLRRKNYRRVFSNLRAANSRMLKIVCAVEIERLQMKSLNIKPIKKSKKKGGSKIRKGRK